MCASGARRLGRRCPDGRGFLVSNVDRLTWRIAHRVVRPRREAVLPAVSGPGEAATGFRDQGAEFRVRHDVAPRSGCRVGRAQVDHIFAAVRGEPAKTVVEEQIGGTFESRRFIEVLVLRAWQKPRQRRRLLVDMREL